MIKRLSNLFTRLFDWAGNESGPSKTPVEPPADTGTETDWKAIEWWLDDAALPDLIWACLVPGLDGIRVHTQSGAINLFETLDDAVAWLRQEEYVTLADLKSDGEVPEDLTPPASFFSPC